MFRARRHPLTTFLVVAAYLAATAVSGLPHDHGALESAGCGPAVHDLAGREDTHAQPMAGAGGVAACEASHGDAPHHDDCVVCRFAGQRVMPAEIGQLQRACDLGRELAAVHACGPAIAIARTTHSRAPPLFG